MRFNVVLFMLIVALLGGLSTCSSEVPIGFDTDELSFDGIPDRVQNIH